jgi:hypothetical protein
MHGAPSVSYPVGRSALAGAILAAAWGAGAAAGLAWWAAGVTGWRADLALATVLAAGAWAAASWWLAPAGLLAWDGSAWSFAEGSAATAEGGALRVALDLQRALLVRWQSPAAARWLWLERGRLPMRWDALRRAVYSRAERDALSGAEPPSARP